MLKRYSVLFSIAFLVLANAGFTQCGLSISTTASTVCAGDNVTLTANATPPQTAFSLTTTMAAGNNHRGNMFDIVAANAVTITSFDAHPMANTTIAIYYKTGSWNTFNNTPGAWTLIGSAAVVAQPTGTPTPVPVPINITIPAGQTYAFYVTSTNTAVSLNYTDGTVVNTPFVNDANITVNHGCGLEYPFSGSPFMPRNWNGIIHYTVPQIATYSYLWSTTATTSSINPTVFNTTQYTVEATVTGCPIMYDTIDVVVSVPPVNAGSDFAVCTGSPVTLSGSGAVSYVWDQGVLDGVPFTPASTASYIVSGTDTIGCTWYDTVSVTVNNLPVVNAGADFAVCTGNQATLSGSGASTYSWDNSVVDGVPFTPSSTMSYIVTGTDVNGCMNTDTTIVTLNALPVVNGGSDQTVCAGSMVTLSGSGAATYLWDNSVMDGVPFAAMSTADYIVTGTDANGCMNTDTVNVATNNLPSVSAGADQAVCAGGQVTLTGNGAVSYTWDNSVTDGVSFIPAATLTYNVTGTDANGCQNTDAVTVTVNTVNASTTVLNETITATASGATYQWINCSNNQPIAGSTAQSFTATVNGSYAVVVTMNGCSDTSACQAISSVGINEQSNNLFSVYPNPTNGEVTLVTGNIIVQEVSIIDVFGKTIASVKPTGTTVNLSLEGYANGIYFVRVTSAPGNVKMIRVVKQ